MLKYTEGDLTVRGIKLHYYRTGGNKLPIVLLHGATDNGLCWARIAEVLAAQYDVIMLDAQGHGLSDRLDDSFSYESHMNQVAAIVKELGLKKPILMGHSMGADTAASVAVAYPNLPRAIVLEDPPWAPLGPPPPQNQEPDGEGVNFAKRLIGFAKMPLEEIIKDGKKMDPSWSDEDRLGWAKSKQQFDPSLFERMVINPRPYEEQVVGIKCPTLLIIADQGIVSKETAQNAAKLWKSKQPFKWVLIKRATHNIRRDNFADYRDAVISFLKALPA